MRERAEDALNKGEEGPWKTSATQCKGEEKIVDLVPSIGTATRNANGLEDMGFP